MDAWLWRPMLSRVLMLSCGTFTAVYSRASAGPSRRAMCSLSEVGKTIGFEFPWRRRRLARRVWRTVVGCRLAISSSRMLRSTGQCHRHLRSQLGRQMHRHRRRHHHLCSHHGRNRRPQQSQRQRRVMNLDVFLSRSIPVALPCSQAFMLMTCRGATWTSGFSLSRLACVVKPGFLC